MTRADNIRPYALGVKYKILRDVREAVPYVIYQQPFALFKFIHRYKILLFYLSVIFPYKRGGYCFFGEN